MEQFSDCYYFPMSSQGNIYSLVELPVNNSFNQVLFASLKRGLYCFEFLDSGKELIPTIKEIQFADTPSGAEVESICAFNKSKTKNDFVIAVAFVKNNAKLDAVEPSLNIYADWKETEKFSIQDTAQNCFTVDLAFMPYHLKHTYHVTLENDKVKSKEHVILISGGDNNIHVYRELTAEHLYKEYDYKEYFPELTKQPSPVQKIDVYYSKDYSIGCQSHKFNVLSGVLQDSVLSPVLFNVFMNDLDQILTVPRLFYADGLKIRVIAICCECGYVRLTKFDMKANKIEFVFSTRFNSYATSVQLFEDHTIKSKTEPIKIHLNMVVVNALMPSVIFDDVLNYGLSKYTPLARPAEEKQIATDVRCVDIDFDGKKEILISSCMRSVNVHKVDEKGDWCLEYIKMVPTPVITFLYSDINGDGVKELIILTLKGVIFLEYNHEYLNKVLDARIKKLQLPELEKLKI